MAEFAKELLNKKTGHPLATGEEIDQQIRDYFTDLRKRGCIVNTSVAIAVGEGILLSKNQSLSTDCLTKDWAKYLFTRVVWSIEKVTLRLRWMLRSLMKSRSCFTKTFGM